MSESEVTTKYNLKKAKFMLSRVENLIFLMNDDIRQLKELIVLRSSAQLDVNGLQKLLYEKQRLLDSWYSMKETLLRDVKFNELILQADDSESLAWVNRK